MSHFQHFIEDVSGIELPEKFTFPFYYEPHSLAIIAAKEVQMQLANPNELEHNFGLENDPEGLPRGKMFGVLVVKNKENELGYLAAFSGNLANKNLPEKFVPPIFNMHTPNSFFIIGEEELNAINQRILELEEDPRFITLKETVASQTLAIEEELKQQRDKMKRAKKARKIRRKEAEASLSQEAFIDFNKKLTQESFNGQFLYKELSEYRYQTLAFIQQELEEFTSQIAALKAERKSKSAILQQKLFDQYQFLNQHKVTKALTDIFPNTQKLKPPAGAGDCSAPKLLQYAFSHDLQPVTMAEFWWGVSPKTEIRAHKNFYPACQGRCKPILAHMLEDIEMDENPFLKDDSANHEIDIVYEDEALLIVNKPSGLLSVPGKDISDSVLTRVQEMYPEATGPLLVHRLDMSTSGILVVAKTKEAHKILQSQFIKRTVKKRYAAILEGSIEQNGGYIELPLRVDLDDRPRQLVCYEHGKHAKTRWQVINRAEGKTEVHFYPITGRTHQLRVHAAHPLGLNAPIVGDDLYGQKADRLHLHAAFIEFVHPASEKQMRFTVKPDFSLTNFKHP